MEQAGVEDGVESLFTFCEREGRGDAEIGG